MHAIVRPTNVALITSLLISTVLVTAMPAAAEGYGSAASGPTATQTGNATLG